MRVIILFVWRNKACVLTLGRGRGGGRWALVVEGEEHGYRWEGGSIGRGTAARAIRQPAAAIDQALVHE